MMNLEEKKLFDIVFKKDASCNAFLWASQACEIAQVFELLTIDKEYPIVELLSADLDRGQ